MSSAAANNNPQTEPIQLVHRPFGLLAELTYRCPLHCPYCSNPVKYPSSNDELSAEEWSRVLEEAAELGVMHVMFSGGEPLLYGELPRLVAHARSVGLYTNLITSAVGLTPSRAEKLKSAGIDSIQISFQADDEDLANSIAGAAAHRLKREAAALVKRLDLPLTINVVLHQGNIARIEAIITMAQEVGAERLELANTQFYGWAYRNKEALLPTRSQLETAESAAISAQKRLRGAMEILYVLPDYFGERPKPCMNGWGRRYITVNPVGEVLPCPTASGIPNLEFDNVRVRSLAWIWRESEAFNRFRGTSWMPEPCKSCELREVDFGGCRCQAALLTGEASNTDPACALSPHHNNVRLLVEAANSCAPVDLEKLIFRLNPT